MNTLLKTALAGVALATMTSAARADLNVFGEVGLPLNPTAQIPQPGGIRLQGNYYDFGESAGIETNVIGLTAAGRVGGNLEVNGGVFRYKVDISGAAAEFGDGGSETGFGVGEKYLISRETEPAGVRLAVGAGYFDVSGLNNLRVYGVATKSFGEVVTAGRTPITGHLGLRYDRYDLDDFGDDSKVSIFAGVEVPITRDGQFQAVGELGTEIADGGGTPYSLSLRYRPAGRPLAPRLESNVRARSASWPTMPACSCNWATPSVANLSSTKQNPVAPSGATGYCFVDEIFPPFPSELNWQIRRNFHVNNRNSTSTPNAAQTARGNGAQTTEVTFVLPESLAQRMRQGVEAGAFDSQNALAREALEHELKRVREAEIARAYAEAAADPLYMADLEECMRDWAPLDADANQYLDVEPNYPNDPSKKERK